MPENNKNIFDVVAIGGGSGGYIAAIRAAQLGFTAACVDDWRNSAGAPALGGVCTNTGCIPAKALLQSTEHYEHARLSFAEHGILTGDLLFDVERAMKRKDEVVKKNNDGILYLFRKNHVAFFHGRASFAGRTGAGDYEIAVRGNKDETIAARHVIVATGSQARQLPSIPCDEEIILSSDGAMRLMAVPRRLVVIGAGVIGLELGSVWRRLGSEVTVLEAAPGFLPSCDAQIAKEALKILQKQGLRIELGVSIGAIDRGADIATIAYRAADGSDRAIEADRVIVSIGRAPNTVGLRPEAVGLQVDERAGVIVDADCRTNLPNVWAIGDVVRGPMLAHKAEQEAVAVAERIAGQVSKVDFNTVPWVIYTHPEIAWVGQNEQQLADSGRAYSVGVFPFLANGRARTLGDTNGMVKILVDAESDQTLGAHIIGPFASELIAEPVLAMEFRASAEDIALVCHAHPTLSEAVKEAALAAQGRALNF